MDKGACIDCIFGNLRNIIIINYIKKCLLHSNITYHLKHSIKMKLNKDIHIIFFYLIVLLLSLLKKIVFHNKWVM